MLKECKRRAMGTESRLRLRYGRVQEREQCGGMQQGGGAGAPSSGLDDKSVISEMMPRGKGRFDIGMFTQLMADMRIPGPGNTDLANFFYCLSQREMRDMFIMTEGIEHDLLAALDLFPFTFVDAVGIRDIGKVPKPKTQHRHFHMPDLNRLNGDVADGKRVFVNVIELEIGNTGIFHIRKSIREFSYDRLLCHFIGIEIHGPMLKKIICPDIIQSGKMVFMRMGKNDGIEMTHIRAQHLVAKIRRGIDDDGSCSGLNKYAGTKSFVLFVGGYTHFAGAGYHRHTSAGAGTQKCDF